MSAVHEVQGLAVMIESKRRWGFGGLREIAQSPAMALGVGIALLIVLAIIIYPIALLFQFSFVDAESNFTLTTLRGAFDQPGIWASLINSMKLVFYVTLWCLICALPLAWLVARTDMPFKNFVRGGAALAFILPSFVMVIAWFYLATPNAGKINQALRQLLGIEQPVFNIMSFSGLVFVEVVCTYPLIFFAVATALATVDSNLENAARLLGASRLRTALTVTFPLVMPAIATGALLTMLDSLSSFGAPIAIGTTANFSVLTTKIYSLLTYPPQLEFAAAISMPIILFTAFCLIVHKYIAGKDRFRTITGKASTAEPIRLGVWRWPMAVASAAFVAMTSLVPFIVIALLSVSRGYGRSFLPQELSLANYEKVFNSSFPIIEAIKNSMFFGALTVVACLILGGIISWYVERTKLPGRTATTFIVMVAYGFPAISFAVAVLLGFIHWFYGTVTIVVIAYVAKKLPIAFVMLRASLKQISPEFEEAARILGAGWFRAFATITIPLLRPAAVISAVLVFALCLRELSMSAILTQPGTTVMSTTVLEFIETGEMEVAAAISVIIVAMGMLATAVVTLLSRKSGISSSK